MFEVFQKYLADRMTLTDSEFELIESVSLIKKLRRRQYFLQEGDVCRHSAFVCKGFLRYYHIDKKGQEHIIQFAPENHWTGDRESLDTGLPSIYNIDAIEDSVILLLTKGDFDMMRKTIPAFNEFVNETLKRNLVFLQERVHGGLALTAEEKYSNFISKYPAISNRVPLHMIASYLGVSAETLSRVRSQSTKK